MNGVDGEGVGGTYVRTGTDKLNFLLELENICKDNNHTLHILHLP